MQIADLYIRVSTDEQADKWFDGAEHRTTRLNDGARIIWQINKEVHKKKEGQVTIIRTCPLGCAHLGSNMAPED
jgi:hypothetical protein